MPRSITQIRFFADVRKAEFAMCVRQIGNLIFKYRGDLTEHPPSILFIIYTEMKLVSKHVRHALSRRILTSYTLSFAISFLSDTKKFSYTKCREADNIKAIIFVRNKPHKK